MNKKFIRIIPAALLAAPLLLADPAHIKTDAAENRSITGLKQYIFGNILQQPLREIWNKSEAHRYLLSLRKKDFPGCCACEDRAYCVKCPGNAFMESGDLYACSEIDKKVTRVTKELYAKNTESAD